MEEHEEEDFIFKPATSPKLTESQQIQQSYNNTNNNTNTNASSNTNSNGNTNRVVQSPQSTTTNSNQNVQTNNIRFPFLDNLINEKKKEMDFELNKLAKNRFEKFLENEQRDDEEGDEEEEEDEPVRCDGNLNLMDRKEEEMFKELKFKSQDTWKELKEEYQKSLEQLHTTQSARLSQELQLQESLQASGSVFDRDLFEKVVEKCGKGRGTTYGKEKMTRFWEVLDKSYPKGSSTAATTSPNKLDDDKLLASLLGL